MDKAFRRIAQHSLSIARRLPSVILLAAALLLAGGLAQAQQVNRKPFGDSLSRYHQERPRTYHLQHILLKVTLDERAKSVSGTSTLTLRPLKSGLEVLEVDSAELRIQSVTRGEVSLPFEQSGEKLRIRLPAPAGPADSITLTIAYSGTPRKGLYFVAPDKASPDKPAQIWSQGEAEDSHFWFPVYDFPNDKATSEGFYTVNADYTVISNGRLVGVEDHPESHTKTYHWKQEVPHSTYLISVVAGRFEKYSAQAGQLPVEYYVPPGTGREKALRSFRETPDAIQFFAEKIGIPYPYPKYAQAAVHDFVFGGMENISAATLTDRTLHEETSEPEVDSLDLVTHELAHQWFGDLLTCEDWSQIWLNEGFATFWEDLYREHRFGTQEYRYVLYQQQAKYLEEDRQRYRRPMVTSFYTDPLDLFDRSAYEKGALFLDMLRSVLGDERFFAAIHHYTQANQQKNVTTDDLRKAVEESSGQDLKWFFDEWAYKAGYPELEVSEQWDEAAHVLHLLVEQKQAVDDNTPLFRMPVEVEFTTPSGPVLRRVELSRVSETFDFPLDGKPVMTRFDPDHRIVDTVKFTKPTAELLYQLKNDPSAVGRIWAAQQLSQSGDAAKSPEAVNAIGERLLQDPFWGVKRATAEVLGQIKTEAARDELARGLNDADARVRQASVRALVAFANDATAARLAESLYQSDRNVVVAAEAMLAAARIRGRDGRKLLESALKRNSDHDVIRRYALRGLGDMGDKKDWDTVAGWLPYGHSPETRMAAIDALVRVGKEQGEKTAARLMGLLDDPDMFVKQRVIYALGEGNFQQARTALMKSAESEADSRIRRSARLAIERLDLSRDSKPTPVKGKTWLQRPLPTPVSVPQQAVVSGSTTP